MNSVFVVRLSAIGDTVIAARAAETLLLHGCDVVFVTHASQRDVVESIPSLKRIVLVDEHNQLKAFVKTDGGFQSVSLADFKVNTQSDAIDLQNTSRSRRALALLQKTFAIQLNVRRVSKRTVYRNALVLQASLFGEQFVRPTSFDTSEIVRVATLQENAVENYLTEKKISFRGPARQYLMAGEPNLRTQNPYVLVFVGASFVLKTWPKEHVRSFIRGVLSSTVYDVILCGGKADAEVGDFLAFDDTKRIDNRVGATSLAEVMALAKHAQFILTNDSFGAHLADAFQKKGAVIFGATSPKFGFAPREDSIHVHYANLDCSPCARHGQGECRFKNLKCLRDVTPENVLKNLK